jgi:hypothetical protein
MFVGKGTVRVLRDVLLRAADKYRAMSRQQGRAIPVLLGGLDVSPPIVYERAVALEHMLFMEWGGDEAWRARVPQCRLQYELGRSLRAWRACSMATWRRATCCGARSCNLP